MNKQRAGNLEGFVSILGNTVLFVIKFWAGIVSGSVALTADAWHTLSDSVSSVIVILGSKLSTKKPDKEHPFGHGRWEYITSIFIGFLLGIVAYDFAMTAIHQFQEQETAAFGTLAIIVTVISILGKEAMAQYAFYLGRKSDSEPVKADGWHHRSDALSSIIILVGIFLNTYFWWVDSVLGLIVAAFIAYTAVIIIKNSINKLLGEKPSPELLRNIDTIIKKVTSQNIYPHHFHIHNYVSHKEITFRIKLEAKQTIKEAHVLVTEIEEALYNELGVRSTIHIEPNDCEHKT